MLPSWTGLPWSQDKASCGRRGDLLKPLIRPCCSKHWLPFRLINQFACLSKPVWICFCAAAFTRILTSTISLASAPAFPT